MSPAREMPDDTGAIPEEKPDAVPPSRSPDAITPPESTYLDLDGDGVPDAVKTSRTLGYDVTGDGVADVVETIDELASEIDITGVPHHVEVTDTVEADVDGDGTLDVVDVVSLDPASNEAIRSEHATRPGRGAFGRTTLARVRQRLRRDDARGFAVTRVRPDSLLGALGHVTTCSAPKGDIRISVDRDVVGLAVHATHAGWWAATAVRARLRRGTPSALTVDRASLEAALRGAAQTHRRGVPMIMRHGEALWVGGNEVQSVTPAAREVSPPPHFDSWETLESSIVVPTVNTLSGETTFPFERGTITTSNGLLRALAAWGVDRVTAFEGAGRVFLLGSSPEHDAVSRIVVTGEARLRYT